MQNRAHPYDGPQNEQDIAKHIGLRLWELASIPTPSDPPSFFTARSIPLYSFPNYVQRIAQYGPADINDLIRTIIYIDRYITDFPQALTQLTAHRLFLTAFLCQMKVFEDKYFNNNFIAKVGGVDLWEINRMEAKFLSDINYKLVISEHVFNSYKKDLLHNLNECIAYYVLADKITPSVNPWGLQINEKQPCFYLGKRPPQYATYLAQIIEAVIKINKSDKEESIYVSHGPFISFTHYFARLIKFTPISESLLIRTALYLALWRKYTGRKVVQDNVNRLFAIAYYLAIHVYSNQLYSDVYFANAAKLTMKELYKLKIQFLSDIRNEILLPQEKIDSNKNEFVAWQEKVAQRVFADEAKASAASKENRQPYSVKLFSPHSFASTTKPAATQSARHRKILTASSNH